MNKKQTKVMWLGIVFTVLIILFPPRYYNDLPGRLISAYSGEQVDPSRSHFYFTFICFNPGTIEIMVLLLLIFCVALVTAGLIYTYRDKAKQVKTCGKCESSKKAPKVDESNQDELEKVICKKDLTPDPNMGNIGGYFLDVDEPADKCPEWKSKDEQNNR